MMQLGAHFVNVAVEPRPGGLAGYTSLGFVAGQTRSMTLSLLVTGVTYRHPGVLATIVTTLDVLPGGMAAPRPREPRTTRPGIRTALISAARSGTVGHTSHSQFPQEAAERSR
jgi:hypothetical protein